MSSFEAIAQLKNSYKIHVLIDFLISSQVFIKVTFISLRKYPIYK